MEYNRVNALIYEIIIFIDRFLPGFAAKPWLKHIKETCRPDWVEFRTRVTMDLLDDEIEDLHQKWDEEQQKDFEFTFIEEESDGSEAQKILGGPMRLTSKWSTRNQMDK